MQNPIEKRHPGLILQRWNERIWFWVRTHRFQYLLLVVLVLISGLVMAYTQITRTTEVTPAKALAEFERRKTLLTPPSVPAVPSQGQPAQVAGAGAAGNRPGTGQSTAGAQTASSTCEWVCATDFVPPESGVYEYFQCGRSSGQCNGQDSEPLGYEKFGGGVSRNFPRTGQRAITQTSPQTWNNIHYYADEHREEFDLSINPSGVFNHRYKIEIQVGPVPGGSEIRQDPPLRFAAWPMSLGQSWNGSWVDQNRNGDADYDCSVTGKEEIQVGSRRLRTWVVACGLHLKGPKQRGEVNVKFWLSPELRNTVQETYDQSLSTPQGDYEGKWMVTLVNDKPKQS